MQLTEEQEFTMIAAQKGYESYCRSTCDDLPKWNSLSSKFKNAWFAAADGVIDSLAKQRLVHNY